MPGPLFVEHDPVALHVAAEEDAAFVERHHNDPAVRASRSVVLPRGRDHVRRYLGGTMGRNDDSLGLLVCDDAGERVGFVFLLRERPADDVYDRAELAFWTAPEHQGNGYATAAGRAVVAHGFERLGLHKVTARAFAFNEPSKRVLEKVGFEHEATLRSEAFVHGEWHDVERFALLEDDWEPGSVLHGGTAGEGPEPDGA